jgi:mRNA-degrading endonuclease toxin of MazEF toxin-antitoxin module
MNVGDGYWVDFPARGGHERAGRRPAIVAQTISASDRLPTVLMIPLTTRLDALRFPGTVAIDPDETNGLRQTCVAIAFQLIGQEK